MQNKLERMDEEEERFTGKLDGRITNYYSWVEILSDPKEDLYPNSPGLEETDIIYQTERFVSKEYNAYIRQDKNHLWFAGHLNNFIVEYFWDKSYKPKCYHLTMFVFPEEVDYTDPMVKIIYPDDKRFDIVKLKNDFTEGFKNYLYELSSNKEEFVEFWKILKDYRIIIRREYNGPL